MEQRVAGRYSVGRKLGNGAFGQVHLGTDIHTMEQVAIKFESQRAHSPMLCIESDVYSHLQECGRFPKVRWYGKSGEDYALVMDLLGDNLENLFRRCGRKFMLKTVLMLAGQMLKLIKYVHSNSFVHRDIKPDNFTIGVGKRANQVFLIDFGFAKRCRDLKTHEHMPCRDGLHMVGTAIFGSINSHDGIEITRRDDLESLGYTLVYFLKGSLPWMGVIARSPASYFRKVREKKVSTSTEELCSDLPSEFASYFLYVRKLQFNEAPHYKYLDKLFKNLFVRSGSFIPQDTDMFDWIKPKLRSASKPVKSERKPKKEVVLPNHAEDSKCKHKRSAVSKLRKAFKGILKL